MTDIRVATPGDAEAVAAIYAPYVEETPISFEDHPPDAAEMGRRIETTTETHPWLVSVEDGKVVGYAYASDFAGRAAYRWTVEVSTYVERDARGRGVGRSLYESLLAILARQGFVEAYAGVALPNPESVGFHESMGFTHQATYPAVGYKDGDWHDVGWWRRPLSRRPDDPAPPMAFSDARAAPWLDEAVAAGTASYEDP